jgi:hypothetical protein
MLCDFTTLFAGPVLIQRLRVGYPQTVASLFAVERAIGTTVYVPPLAASIALCWAGPKPPPLRILATGVVGATSLAVCLAQSGLTGAALHTVVVSLALAWFKLGGVLYPPAAALSALFLDNSHLQDLGFGYVFCPCLVGNVIIWGVASLAVETRRQVREAAVQHVWGQRLSPSTMQLLADLYGDTALTDAELCDVLAELTSLQNAPDDECVIDANHPDAAGQSAMIKMRVAAANRRAKESEDIRDPTEEWD